MNIRIIGNEDAFSKHIKNNWFIYVVLLIIFTIGIVVGAIYYRNISDEKNLSDYIQETLSRLTETDNIDSYDILKDTIIRNIEIAILFWILGASVVGIPILLAYIAYKGFTLGFTISTILATFGFVKGNMISLAMLFSQNIFTMFAMLVAMVSGFKLAVNLLARRKDVKFELIRHTAICLFCMLIFLVSSFVETFFNGPILGYILTKIK